MTEMEGAFFLLQVRPWGGGTILRSYTELVVKVEARASCLRESKSFLHFILPWSWNVMFLNVAPSPFVGRGCFLKPELGDCAKSE